MALTVTQAQPDQTISGVTQTQPGTISGVSQVPTQPALTVSSNPVGTGSVDPQAAALDKNVLSPTQLNPQSDTINPQGPTANPNTLDPNSQINTGQGITPATDLPTGLSFGAPAPSPSETAFQQMQASGTPPPQDSSSASGAVSDALKQTTPIDNSKQILAVNTTLDNDPGYQQLLADKKEYENTVNQTKSMVDTYTQLLKDSGVSGINTELLNMKNIIQGTEDDIRKEVQSAGGFATDSQVLALSSARNKQLVKNYNALLDQKNMLMDQVNTMVGLASQDRQFALSSINQRLQIDQQLADYAQKFKSNAQEAYKNVISAVGYGGLYKALSSSGDPNAVALAEKTLGLAPGGLQSLANYVKPLSPTEQLDYDAKQFALQQAKAEAPLDLQLKKAQIASTNRANQTAAKLDTQIVDVNGTKVLINSQTGAIIKTLSSGDTATTLQQQAQSKANIDLISGLTSSSALNSSVGPNYFARLSVFNQLSGAKSNFIAGVQQLTSQLTLDTLIKAKAQGATFGALSEGELNILSGAASKLNTWAIKDSSGNVTGYNTSEKDFRAELDKINNFAKLDYILKGGNPNDIGVQTMPDGTHWVINSDGTLTQL